MFILLTVVAVGTAQEVDRQLPERGLEREAPVREAVILQQERLSETAVRTVIELPATADTYIASERPNQNFGADALFLGYNLDGDHYGAQRMLLRFDVENQIPPGAVVTEAHLRLRLSFSSPVA
ncbi:MAG: DNRLRE domain-containing protein, partial [Chloroflexota bacterium]